MRQVYCLLFCLFLLTAALPVFAQEATIVGTVTDNSGALVPNATITITNTDTGQVRTVTSNDAGQYVATALRIGKYTVKVEAKGFAVTEKSGVVLNVGDRDRVDFNLNVGGKTETVSVEANAINVRTDSGEVSTVVDGAQVTQIATNGRSLYSLVTLTPGASSAQADFQVPTPMGGDQNVSFNGQRVAHNLYMVDGAEAADRGGSGAIVMPSIDGLAEFRNLTSNYSAEYGMSSAATVTMVLKSGTRSLHGSGWWFGRNDVFNAKNYFLDKVAKERFNLWGFNIGGPVQFSKNANPKTFFFYNMEWRRRITAGSAINTTVPIPSTYGGDLNAAVNAGNFLTSGNTNLHAPFSCRVSPAVQTAFANAGQALSGCTAGSPDNALTVPFMYNGVANVINPALLDANAKALLASGIFPAPNSGRNFVGGPNAPTNVKEEMVRMDHQFNDKFSIYGHFIAEQILQTDIPTRWSGGANLPTVYDTFGNPSYSAVVHATNTISPTLLNEIAFNYGGNRINIAPQGKYLLTDTGFKQNKLFGFQSLNTPIIAINGKMGARYDANWTPWVNKADSYQVRDDLSWSHGNHQWKFGGGWLGFFKLQPLQVSPQGTFNFGGGFTGYDYADFLLGLAGSYSEPALKDDRNWNSQSFFLYAQDNWRVNNRLTLNLGLRWDGMPHTYEANGQMSNFVPGLYDPTKAPLFANANGTQICSPATATAASCIVNGAAVSSPGLATGPNPALNGLLQYANGLAVPGKTPGTSNGLVNNHWLNFGPRIGFAYDLTGRGKTVARGGFGIMFERLQGNDMYQNGGNNLFGGTTSNFGAVSLSDPHMGVDQNNLQITGGASLPVTVNSIRSLDVNQYKNPTSYQYSAGLQQGFGTQTVLTVSYVGNQNRHLSYFTELNLPDASLLPTLYSGSTNASAYNTLLPYKGYKSVLMAYNGGNSNYNSMQVEMRSKMHGLQLQAAYTLSKAEDPTTGTGGDGWDLNSISNPYAGWRYDQGPSPFDRTHVAFVNFIYDIPVFKNASKSVKYTLGGWQVSGVVTLQSGAPINLGVSGNTVCGIVQNCSVRPNLTGTIAYPHSATGVDGTNRPTVQWFDPSAFSKNIVAGTAGQTYETATWGNLGHDALRGPGRHNWNMALFKNFYMTERLHLEFRTEVYNLWNHTQLKGDTISGGIGTNLGGSNFGKVTSAYDARNMQFGLKLIY